jgi:opacity protein-like surface antigen
MAGTLPAAAQQAGPGGYIAGGGGLSVLQDARTQGSASATHQFDPGWLGLGAAGYAFDSGFRMEGELGYRRNEADGGAGHAQAWTLMGNALYDFKTGTRFTPYVGAGVGGARLKFDDIPAGATSIDDSDTVLAYQGLAGIAYHLDSNVTFDLGYRYLGTERPSFRTRAGGSVDSEYDNHAVMLGLRYQFNGR